MPLSLRLPADLEERLDDLAKRTGRTKTYYATQAICEMIEDLEDYIIAEERMADIRSGKEKTISLDDLIAKYGLED